MTQSVDGSDYHVIDLPDRDLGASRHFTRGRWWPKRTQPDGDKPGNEDSTRKAGRADIPRERGLGIREPSTAPQRSLALTAIDPRTDRSSAEAALADPRVSAALMDSGAEIPEWAVSPRILLNVTGMGADHCARLLAHPAITPSGLEYIAERMTVAVASTLAGRRATPAGALDALARKRSDEQILMIANKLAI